MKATTGLELDQLVNRWADATEKMDPESLTAFAMAVATVFEVKADEVAILALVEKGKSLRFLIPGQLRAIGTIPLNSNSALAARTARERRPDMINTFAGSRHATVFEGVPMGRGQDESIQKIMSAPILENDAVVGVVQISRKGRSQKEAGADFTTGDLKRLQALTPTLARVIQLSQKG